MKEKLDDLNEILDDIKRYKQILDYQYKKYLGEKETDLLLKKLDLINKEISVKVYLINEKSIDEEEYHVGKSR